MKPIPGWPNHSASEDGRIFSRRGELKPQRMRNGYSNVTLRDGGRVATPYVHALILETFIGPRPPGYCCAHGDGTRTNNALSNLRWASPKENEADKITHGTKTFGERNGSSRLTVSDVAQIRNSLETKTLSQIAAEFGVCRETVAKIRDQKTWRNH